MIKALAKASKLLPALDGGAMSLATQALPPAGTGRPWTATREFLAAFLNDLNDECLARWGPPARALAGLGLGVTSCQDDEGVIEKDGDPGTARQRVVAVEAPRQRAKPPFSRRSEGCRWRQAMWT